MGFYRNLLIDTSAVVVGIRLVQENYDDNVLSTWIAWWREKITWLQSLEGLSRTSTVQNVYQTSCDTRRGDQWLSILQPDNTSYPRSHLSPGYKLTRRATTCARCPLRHFYIYVPITQSLKCSAVFRRENAVRCNELSLDAKMLSQYREWLTNSNKSLAYTNIFIGSVR